MQNKLEQTLSDLIINKKEKFGTTLIKPYKVGKLQSIVGTVIECIGIDATVGELFGIENIDGNVIKAEVIGIKDGKALLLPFDKIVGLKEGCIVYSLGNSLTIKVGEGLMGRVLDANAQPIDGKGKIARSDEEDLYKNAPTPLEREPIRDVFNSGIRSIDAFNTIGIGQRLGLFAGSGVGKSVLMGMIAKNSSADVNVIGLIGERGREVQEFVSDTLGPDGLKKSIVIASTSDTSAMSRIKAVFTATAIAEYYRDKGLNVLLMIDSITRVAMAQREIGLATGEPPTSKGYTPSVFSLLPKLLERPGKTKKGSITALYTVLVDNDDMNEPIADAVRSILDGHIVLSRKLAHKNHYPAIDVLESISRVMANIVTKDQRNIMMKARSLLAIYQEAEDLINIGAYVSGSSKKIDEAVEKNEKLVSFLIQDIEEIYDQNGYWSKLEEIVS